MFKFVRAIRDLELPFQINEMLKEKIVFNFTQAEYDNV